MIKLKVYWFNLRIFWTFNNVSDAVEGKSSMDFIGTCFSFMPDIIFLYVAGFWIWFEAESSTEVSMIVKTLFIFTILSVSAKQSCPEPAIGSGPIT